MGLVLNWSRGIQLRGVINEIIYDGQSVWSIIILLVVALSFMTCLLISTDDDLLHSPFDEIIEVTPTLGPSEVVEIDPVDRRGITYNYVFHSDIPV